MAVSANAVSLAQYGLMSNNPLVTGITFGLLQNSIVLQDIPIPTKASMIVNGNRWVGSLPGVNWSKLNVDPVVVSGTPSTFQEQVFIPRNAIDVDRWILVDQNQIVDPRQAQLQAYLKSFAYDYNAKFINNSPTNAYSLTGNTTDAITGIRHRIDNPMQYGVKMNAGGTAEAKIDAGGTTAAIGPTNRSATTGQAFLEKLDQLLWAVDAPDGTNVILYMNDDVIRKFQTVLRLMGSSALDITRDNYDRQIMTYKNAVIRDIGYNVDQTTRIITSTESNTGANSTSTFSSIYAIRADLDHFFAWQMAEMIAQDVGLVGNGGSTYRMVFDWATGLIQIHPRAIGRLYDISVN